MIKVTISELLNSVETLQKIAKKDFKAKLAWQIARLLKVVESEIQDFSSMRLNLINKYGEKDKNGTLITDENGNCKIAADFVNTFSNELNDLMSLQIEINAEKLKLSDMEDLDFTPSDIVALEPFLDIEE